MTAFLIVTSIVVAVLVVTVGATYCIDKSAAARER